MPSIRVLFFGATSDAVGLREIEVEVAADDRVGSVVHLLEAKYPVLKKRKLLTAVNENYVPLDTFLHDRDELALFTAVSGG